jgi:hypothetical protein
VVKWVCFAHDFAYNKAVSVFPDMEFKMSEKRHVYLEKADRLSDIASAVRKTFESEPESRSFGETQLSEVLSDLVKEFGCLQDTALDSNESPNTRHTQIVLCAYLEWFSKVGGAARVALDVLGRSFEEKAVIDLRSEAKTALDGFNSELVHCPLFDDYGLGQDKRKTLASMTGKTTEKELSVENSVTIPELCYVLGIRESTVLNWIGSRKVDIQRDEKVTSSTILTSVEAGAIRSEWLRELIHSVIDEPEDWMSMPNPWLGGHSPDELIGTDREQLVIDIVEGVRQGVAA